LLKIPSRLFAPSTDGFGQTALGNQPVAVKEPKRSIVRYLSMKWAGSGQLSHHPRPRHRRSHAPARLAISGGLALNPDDVLLSEGSCAFAEGKQMGSSLLAPETIQLLDHYTRLERPNPCSAAFLYLLKGPARGQRMTALVCVPYSGIIVAPPESARQSSSVRHRSRSDMVRAGVSLPASCG